MFKYKNKKTVIDGITFDSKIEGRYYLYFRELEKQGEISELKLQVPYPIIIEDKKICKYLADFTYKDSAGFLHIIDIKSPATAKDRTFRLKKKLVEAIYDIKIELLGI